MEVVFANSTIDFNAQAGIIAGGFVACILSTLVLGLLLYKCCCSLEFPACHGCAIACDGECTDCGECCCCLSIKWMCFKMCQCCCIDVKRKLKKHLERIRKHQEEEDREEEEREQLEELQRVEEKRKRKEEQKIK